MGPRIAYYNYLLKQGVDSETAAWESVNLQNFSRSGAGGGVSGSLLAHLIPMVPFLNAKMQGLFRLFEHGTIGAPESFISKGAMGIPKAIVYRGMMLAFVELGLNAIYGDVFKLPEPVIQEEVMIIPGLDGRKMSKSYGNEIAFLCEEKELRKKLMSLKTDSTGLEEPKALKGSLVGDLFTLFGTPSQFADLE
ncbi:MAG: hypothetical protein EBU84_21440, partial [Actinobacteria bacterium]|nr:hypothetical protein [Actinomycetota bacterium]